VCRDQPTSQVGLDDGKHSRSLARRANKQRRARHKEPTRLHGNTKIQRWRAHYRTPDGNQRNKTFARKVDADRFLTTVESSKITGTFVDPSRSRVTFSEMASKWTASKVGLKPSRRAVYAAVMGDHVLPRWEKVPLSSIEHEDVRPGWTASG
jgi:hypothetical protein